MHSLDGHRSHLINRAFKWGMIECHEDEAAAATQTTFFCSLSMTDLILQHMNAKLPPGTTSTHKEHCQHSITCQTPNKFNKYINQS